MTWIQLEEVQIKNTYEVLAEYALFHVRNFKYLKRIRCARFDGKVDSTHSIFETTELNRAREKLENACELTIFTNCEGNATNLDHKLVKLNVVKFEPSYWEVDPNFV